MDDGQVKRALACKKSSSLNYHKTTPTKHLIAEVDVFCQPRKARYQDAGYFRAERFLSVEQQVNDRFAVHSPLVKPPLRFMLAELRTCFVEGLFFGQTQFDVLNGIGNVRNSSINPWFVPVVIG